MDRIHYPDRHRYNRVGYELSGVKNKSTTKQEVFVFRQTVHVYHLNNNIYFDGVYSDRAHTFFIVKL